YNDLGLLNLLTYPCHALPTTFVCGDSTKTLTHTYANGMLNGITGWASSVSYQPNGVIASVTHASSSPIYETWLPDPNGMARPCAVLGYDSSVTLTDDPNQPCGKAITGVPLLSTGNYGYDGAGNIKQIGNTSYSYDLFNRLVTTTTTGGTAYNWSANGYDTFG